MDCRVLCYMSSVAAHVAQTQDAEPDVTTNARMSQVVVLVLQDNKDRWTPASARQPADARPAADEGANRWRRPSDSRPPGPPTSDRSQPSTTRGRLHQQTQLVHHHIMSNARGSQPCMCLLHMHAGQRCGIVSAGASLSFGRGLGLGMCWSSRQAESDLLPCRCCTPTRQHRW